VFAALGGERASTATATELWPSGEVPTGWRGAMTTTNTTGAQGEASADADKARATPTAPLCDLVMKGGDGVTAGLRLNRSDCRLPMCAYCFGASSGSSAKIRLAASGRRVQYGGCRRRVGSASSLGARAVTGLRRRRTAMKVR